MKRVMILAMIVIISSAAVSAGDVQVGVMQNLLNTGLLFDAESKYAGVEASLGFPVVSGAVTAIEACVNNSDAEETGEGRSSSFAAPLGVMANVYFKVIRAERFNMRLGLQADVLGIFGPDFIWVTGYSGVSLGADFRLNARFSMNFTTCVPLVVILNPISEDVGEHTMVFYTSGKGSTMGDVLLGIYGGPKAVAGHMARISFKWSI